MNAFGRLTQLSRWSNLRAIGNLTAVRLTVAFPLIGYLILVNESLRGLLRPWSELNQDFDIDKLLFVYFGLLFVALASLVYSVACPKEVRTYPNAESYIVAVHEVLAEQGHINKYIEAHDPAWLEQHKKNLQFNREVKNGQVRGVQARELPSLNDFRRGKLERYYTLLDLSLPETRVLCLISFAIGFGCLVVPSSQVLLSVISITFARIFS